MTTFHRRHIDFELPKKEDAVPVGSVAWGSITGTLSAQTDLQTVLDGKEPLIAAGTANKFFSWDKTWRDVDWAFIINKPSTFTPSAHLLVGPDHTASGLTVGQVVRATAATTFTWGNVDWTEVINKPSTFPPSTHTHLKTDITDFSHDMIAPYHTASGLLVGTVVRATGATTFAWTFVEWLEISGRPSTFPPSAHTHVKADVTDFNHELVGTNHTESGLTTGHVVKATGATAFDWAFVAWTEITGKPSTFPPDAHTHPKADITGLPWIVSEGGTGVVSITGILQGNGTSALTAISNSSTVGQVLRVTGASVYGWGALDLDDTDAVTGSLGVSNGGTNLASYAIGDILYASASTTIAKLADVATGNVIISGGVGVAPLYGKVGLTTHISGTLGVGNGGSGATTLTGILRGNASSAFTAITSSTVGQILRVTGADTFAWGALDLADSDAKTGLLPLSNGGLNANLTASNGGIFYSTASAGAILSGTATAGLALISGASTTPSWFTPTAGSVIFAGIGGILQQDNANFFWDNSNNWLGLGTTTPKTTLYVTGGEVTVVNSSGFTLNSPGIGAGNLTTGGTASGINIYKRTLTTFPTTPTAGERWAIYNPDGSLRFWTPTATDVVKITQLGSVVCYATLLANNATDGFLYIPTCSGTPTGTPTNQGATRAMVFDTTGNKLWVYDGAWIGVALT